MVLQQHHMGLPVHRAPVDMQRCPVAQRCGQRGQPQPHINAGGGQQCACVGDPVTAADVITGDGRQVQRAALPGHRVVTGLVLRVDAAYAHFSGGRHQLQMLTHRGDAAVHCAGHQRAVAGQREHAVHRHAEQLAAQFGLARAGVVRRPSVQLGTQRVDASIVGCGAVAGEHRGILQRRAGQQGSDLDLDPGQARRIHTVDLGERHRTAVHAQQLQDGQMLAGLWHHAVVGSDDQQGDVDTRGAGHHRMHEAFMARHIDEAQRRGRSFDVPAFHRDIGVAQFDRYAARTLFPQAIGFDAGQCAYQACFAMVDMPGGADDHACSMLHWARKAASSAGSRQRKSSHNASSAMRPSTGRGS